MLNMQRNLWIAGLMAAALIAPSAAAEPASYRRDRRPDDSRRDDYRRPEQSRAISRIAHELEENAQALVQTARAERYFSGRVDNYALAGFQEFLGRASRFHALAESDDVSSRRLEEAYNELRRSYEIAYRYFPTIRDSARNAEIKRRVAANMNSLIDIYDRPVRVPDRPRRHVDWHQIDNLSKAIERQTDATYEAAKDDDGDHWRGGKENRRRGLDSLKRIETMADEYRKTVARAQDRPDITYDGMRKLAEAYRDAQRWMGSFDSRTRERFNELGKLIWSLESAYENPRRPIGPAPHR